MDHSISKKEAQRKIDDFRNEWTKTIGKRNPETKSVQTYEDFADLIESFVSNKLSDFAERCPAGINEEGLLFDVNRLGSVLRDYAVGVRNKKQKWQG